MPEYLHRDHREPTAVARGYGLAKNGTYHALDRLFMPACGAIVRRWLGNPLARLPDKAKLCYSCAMALADADQPS